jgi:hypothetical protein
MRKQIVNACGEIVIGRQQADAAGHHAVPVVVGVARNRHVESILQPDQGVHGKW